MTDDTLDYNPFFYVDAAAGESIGQNGRAWIEVYAAKTGRSETSRYAYHSKLLRSVQGRILSMERDQALVRVYGKKRIFGIVSLAKAPTLPAIGDRVFIDDCGAQIEPLFAKPKRVRADQVIPRPRFPGGTFFRAGWNKKLFKELVEMAARSEIKIGRTSVPLDEARALVEDLQNTEGFHNAHYDSADRVWELKSRGFRITFAGPSAQEIADAINAREAALRERRALARIGRKTAAPAAQASSRRSMAL